MFRRLKLTRFGRFANLELDLAKTTVICGDAESGKTTIFDALASAMVGDDPGVGAPRWPSAEPPVLEGDEPQMTTPLADTIGLCASREGELHFGCDAFPEPTWQAGLDARLRAASIDAAALAAEFSHKASADPTLPHNQERRRLASRREQAIHEQQGLRAARLELAGLTRQQAELGATLTELDAQGARRRAELHEEQERQRQSRADQDEKRRRLETELTERRAQETDLDALAELTQLEPDELAELATLHSAVESYQDNLARIEARTADSQTRVRQLGEKISADRAREPQARQAAGKAAVLGLRLDQFLNQPPTRERQRWRIASVVLSLLLWGVAITSINHLGWLSGLSRSPWAAALPYLGLLLGGVLGTWGLLRSRELVHELDREARDRMLTSLREEWRAANLPALPDGRAEQLRAFFAEQVESYERLRHDLDLHAAQKCRVEDELGTILERSRAMLEQTLGARREAERAWLAVRRLAGFDEATALQARRAELEDRLRRRGATWTFAPTADARRQQIDALEAELARLTQAEPGAADRGARALAEATRVLEQQITRRQQLQDELDLLAAHAADLRRTLGADDDGTPTQEQALGAEIQALDEELTRLEVERQTAAAAAVLFTEMAQNERLHLDLLAQEIRDLLHDAGLADVEVAVSGLSEAEVELTDAHGERQPLTRLSRTRRDLAVLAARLCLADKLLVGSARLVLLEEPFLRLRGEWLTWAENLVARFAARFDGQLVLVTGDREVAHRLQQTIADAELVDLDQAGTDCRVRAA